MISAADLKIERGYGIVGGGDVGVEVGLGDILGECLSFLFQKSVWGSYPFSPGGRGSKGSPWAVKMAANKGLASSKVRVDRAMKACKKARLLSLY